MKMKPVLLIGAGHVTAPIVDYLSGQCGLEVTMAARTVSRAKRITGPHLNATAVSWQSGNKSKLDRLVARHGVVINMIPKAHHLEIALACLKHRRSMVTTSYETPFIKALDSEARRRGVLILNELGEDPGMDHFATQMLLDGIDSDGGGVIALNSYGAGLPSFRFNNNPMGYKFSWEPKGVFLAARVPALYLDRGREVPVAGNALFEHFKMVDIPGLGVFEAYPNKDVTRYTAHYGLPPDVTFFRGLLRFSGYCNNMRYFLRLGLLNDTQSCRWKGKTYRDFAAFLIGKEPGPDLEQNTAVHLGVDRQADIMKRLKWLGLFEPRPIETDEGSKLDVFVQLLLRRLTYAPGETDMTIIHVDVMAKFPRGDRTHRTATMVAHGESGGGSAMAKAVGLPPAFAAQMILAGEIREAGVHMPPTLPALYRPMLERLEHYGFVFKTDSRPAAPNCYTASAACVNPGTGNYSCGGARGGAHCMEDLAIYGKAGLIN